MMGNTHRIFGALAGATVASVSGESRSMIVMTALVASSTAHGWASPDVDQTAPWQAVSRSANRFLPVFAHRHGLSHWWGLPLLAWWAIQFLPADAHWPAVALLIGWSSHLVGDFIFGTLSLLPWGGPRFGLGLRTGGWVEQGPVTAAIVVGIALVVWFTPGMPTGAPHLPSIPTAATATRTPAPTRTVPKKPTAKKATPKKATIPAYDRAAFGPTWMDVDHNGCDTRDDILTRDLTDRTYRDKCVVLTGTLTHDLYTGRTITWTKAKATAVQIDHIVSLSEAWRDGAYAWTLAQREAIANDPFNLVAVDGPTNASKGDQGPDTWSPADKGDACRYVTRYVLVKAKYGLPMTPAESASISHTLTGCNERTAP